MSLFLRARLWWGKKRFADFGRGVARCTSIPVPKAYGTYYVDGHLYIEMEYFEGETLEAAWFANRLSPAEKKAVIEELAGYIRQLRRLEPPQKGAVASAEFKQCLDHRMGYTPVGPFLSHEDFHSFLRGHIPIESCTYTGL